MPGLKVGDKIEILFLVRKNNDCFLLAIDGFPIIKIGCKAVFWKIDEGLQEIVALVKKKGHIETAHGQEIGPEEIEIRGPKKKISDALRGIDITYSPPHRCKGFNSLSETTRRILATNLKLIMKERGKLSIVWESVLGVIEDGSLDISLDNIIDQAAGFGVEVKDLFDPNYRFRYEPSVNKHSWCS